MTSSTGWFRANFVYDTLKEPPSPGSPLEAVCAFIFMSRQRASFLTSKALIQAAVTEETKDAVQELLDGLHDAMFPYEKQEKACEAEKTEKIMSTFNRPIAVSKI